MNRRPQSPADGGADRTGVGGGKGSGPVALAAAATLVFLALVFFTRAFHPEGSGFDTRGLELAAYNAARVLLAGFICLLCYVAGCHALSFQPARLAEAARSPRALFILCFFLGASLYGIVFSVLGLFGQINLAATLALTLPVLATAGRPLMHLLPRQGGAGRHGLAQSACRRLLRGFDGALWLLLAACVGMFVLTRVVFVANVDGNVWEHYLHYYREVVATGSTLPGDVWHHFYNSKGGGLSFLGTVLSDLFGVQLASTCMVAVAGLIVFDLARRYGRSLTLALFATILFFAFMFGEAWAGTMFRVHAVILGYASFALWATVMLVDSRMPRAPLLVALLVSMVYLGFYQPVASALFPAAFVSVVLIHRVLGERIATLPLVAAAAAVCAGSTITVAINWMLTGLPEVTPMRLLWEIADQAKAAQVFGLGGVEFFLAVDNDLSPSSPWFLRAFAWTLRRPLPEYWMAFAVLAMLPVAWQVVARWRAGAAQAKADLFLLQVAAFLAPLLALAIVVPSPSVYRMGVYSVVLSCLALVVLSRRLLDLCPVRLLKVPLLVLLVGSASVVAAYEAARTARPHAGKMLRFAVGHWSMQRTFEAMESPTPLGATSIKSIAGFRERTNPAGRFLSLGYDAGYAYLLPGNGIVSEPTYAVVRDPEWMLKADAAAVAAEMRRQDIDFFVLNLNSRLFTTVAFSALFDPVQMPRMLGLAHEDGDLVILTWAGAPGTRPLPRHLLLSLEMKRSGALHYPWSADLARRVGVRVLEREAEREAGRERGRGDGIGTLDGLIEEREKFMSEVRTIFSEVEGRLALPESREVLARALEVGLREAAGLDLKEQFRGAEPRRTASGDVRWLHPVPVEELRRTLLANVQEGIKQEFSAVFGSRLAALSRQCDERVPFGRQLRPDDAVCR